MIQHIHIPKTAGNALAQAYASHDTIHRNGHAFRLSMLKPGDDAVTIVRDPVSRFVSGFGWIAKYRRDTSPVPWPWDSADDMAHDMDELPDLYGDLQVFIPQSHWLDGNLDRLIWVGRTETLHADFARLCERTGLPPLPGLPPPGPASNTGPPHQPLSERAEANIRAWYADDYALLRDHGWL